MKAKSILLIILGVALAVLLPLETNGQILRGDQGFRVIPVCAEDLICHFEEDPCGTIVGEVIYCGGMWNYGICISGKGHIDLGDDDSFSTGILEIECQVQFNKFPEPGDHPTGVITKYDSNDPTASEWGLFVEAISTREVVWMVTGDGSQWITSETFVELREIYHVRVMFCGGIAGIWVNGDLIAAGPIGRNLNNTDTPVIVGNSASGENYFHGTIDELRIGCNSEPCAPTPTEESSWGIIKHQYK